MCINNNPRYKEADKAASCKFNIGYFFGSLCTNHVFSLYYWYITERPDGVEILFFSRLLVFQNSQRVMLRGYVFTILPQILLQNLTKNFATSDSHKWTHILGWHIFLKLLKQTDIDVNNSFCDYQGICKSHIVEFISSHVRECCHKI